jgi:hypothetical protein
MIGNLQWRGPMVISKHVDSDVIIGGELEFREGSLYFEKRILIDALDQWLAQTACLVGDIVWNGGM